MKHRWILLTAASLTAYRALPASCPRTGGETARRVIPSILFYPAAPFIRLHKQSRVPMPSAGARVRVSHEVDRRVRFTEGRFVSATDSVMWLVTAGGDTISMPFATARCLQVYRSSRRIGAALGFLTGIYTGFAIGLGVGAIAFPDDAEVMLFTAVIGGGIGQIAGPVVGYRRGASAWDIAWERLQ